MIVLDDIKATDRVLGKCLPLLEFWMSSGVSGTEGADGTPTRGPSRNVELFLFASRRPVKAICREQTQLFHA
ncbi:ATPase family AAA domain-containing protein 5 [Clarias magur]|uniref:ATPase family AAA domain-containing protein 5 n=1 Tax=Clarias magur TaxID=1594786 RepID=A0A8J4UR43_CLAMG|nr:ATPase family AAA domain-containing protein 5 [Clarias magur]